MDDDTPPIPAWAAAADIVAVSALWIAAAVSVSGGFRLWLGPIPFSSSAPTGPLVVAAIAAALRHWLVPRPHILRRVSTAVLHLIRSDAFRAVRGPFAATRIAVLLTGVFAVYAIGFAPGEPRVRASDNELLNLPMRWDAGWYTHIARNGYSWDPRATGQQNVAFFPALPLLVRGIGEMWGDREPVYVLTAAALSHIAFFWSLLLLYQLARAELGDDGRARTAVLLLACYPFSVFHGAAYTESLFLLTVLGSVLEVRRERWGRAAAWGLLAGLTRPNGFLLSVTVALLAWSQRVWAARSPAVPGHRRRSLWGAGAAAAAPVLGVALFSWYIGVRTGNPLRWFQEQGAWGRHYKGLPFGDAIDLIAGRGVQEYVAALPYDVVNGAAAVWALVLIVPVSVRFGLAYGVFVAVNVLPPLFLGGTMSIGRLTSTMFPLFLWLAARPERPLIPLAIAFAVLQGLAATLFYTWRPLF